MGGSQSRRAESGTHEVGFIAAWMDCQTEQLPSFHQPRVLPLSVERVNGMRRWARVGLRKHTPKDNANVAQRALF